MQFDNLGDSEHIINDFLFLISWQDYEVFYFKIEKSENNKHVAIILFREMRLDVVEKACRKMYKEIELKENPDLKSRLENLNKFFFSNKIKNKAQG